MIETKAVILTQENVRIELRTNVTANKLEIANLETGFTAVVRKTDNTRIDVTKLTGVIDLVGTREKVDAVSYDALTTETVKNVDVGYKVIETKAVILTRENVRIELRTNVTANSLEITNLETGFTAALKKTDAAKITVVKLVGVIKTIAGQEKTTTENCDTQITKVLDTIDSGYEVLDSKAIILTQENVRIELRTNIVTNSLEITNLETGFTAVIKKTDDAKINVTKLTGVIKTIAGQEKMSEERYDTMTNGTVKNVDPGYEVVETKAIILTQENVRIELRTNIVTNSLEITNLETGFIAVVRKTDNTRIDITKLTGVIRAIAGEEKISAENYDTLTTKAVRNIDPGYEVVETEAVIPTKNGETYNVRTNVVNGIVTVKNLETNLEMNVDAPLFAKILKKTGTNAILDVIIEMQTVEKGALTGTISARGFDKILTNIRTGNFKSAIKTLSADISHDGIVYSLRMNISDTTMENIPDLRFAAILFESVNNLSTEPVELSAQNKVIHTRIEYKGVVYDVFIDTSAGTVTAAINKNADAILSDETIRSMIRDLSEKTNKIRAIRSDADPERARTDLESILSTGELKVLSLNAATDMKLRTDLLSPKGTIIPIQDTRDKDTLDAIERAVMKSMQSQSDKLANLPENEVRDIAQREYDGYHGMIRGDLKYVVSMEGKGEIIIDGRDHAGERLIDVLAIKFGLSNDTIERMTREFGGILPYEVGGVVTEENDELRHRPSVKAVIRIASNGEIMKLGETDIIRKSDNIIFQYHTHPDVATDVRQYLADWLNMGAKAEFFGIDADRLVPMYIYEKGTDNRIAEIKRLFAEKDAIGITRMVLERYNSKTGKFETVEGFEQAFGKLDAVSMLRQITLPDTMGGKRFTIAVNEIVINAILIPIGTDNVTGEPIFEFRTEHPVILTTESILSRAGPSIAEAISASAIAMMARNFIYGEEPALPAELFFEIDSEDGIHVIKLTREGAEFLLTEIAADKTIREQILPIGEILQNTNIVESGIGKLTSSEQKTFKKIVTVLSESNVYSTKNAEIVLTAVFDKTDRSTVPQQRKEGEIIEKDSTRTGSSARTIVAEATLTDTKDLDETLKLKEHSLGEGMILSEKLKIGVKKLLAKIFRPTTETRGITQTDTSLVDITGKNLLDLMQKAAAWKNMLKEALMLFDDGFVSLVGETAVDIDSKGFETMLKGVHARNEKRKLAGQKKRNVMIIVGESETNQKIADMRSTYSDSLIYCPARRLNNTVRQTMAEMNVGKLRITGITTKADTENVQSRILSLADSYMLADAKGAIFGLMLVLMVTRQSDFTCAYTAEAARKIKKIIEKDSQKANRPTITFTGANNAGANDMIDEFLQDLTEAEVSF